MTLRHPAAALAAVAGWLFLTTGYAAAAAEPAVDLGGADLPGGAGSPSPADPTVVTAGLWRDVLGGGTSAQAVHHFTYRRTMQDSTVHIGVVGAPTAPGSDQVTLEVFGPEKASCGSDYQSPDYSVPEAVFGSAVVVGPDEVGDRESVCLTAAELGFTLTRGSSAEGDLPVAIKVVEEATPSAADLEELPDEPRYEVGTTEGETTERAGASSFADAPEVGPGDGPVTTTITEGEEQLWRVPVGWGESLSAVAEVPAVDEDLAEELGFTAPSVDLRIVEPSRNTLRTARDETVSVGEYGEEPLDLEVATTPVDYRNRFDDRPPYLPGSYWVAVAVEDLPQDAERERVEVPVTLSIAVTSGPAGAPGYPGSVLAPDGSAGPEGYDPGSPFLIGAGQFSAVASDAPVAPGDEDDGWWGARRYAGIGLAVASLLCCGLGVRRLRS